MPPHPKPEKHERIKAQISRAETEIARKARRDRRATKRDMLENGSKVRRHKKKKGLRKDPYLHPAWITLRDKVRVRAKGRCESPHCRGCANGAHVHHLRYNEGKRGWRRLIVAKKWLLLLCEDCHNREHPTNFRGQMLHQKLNSDFFDD